MAGEENLIPMNELTEEKQRELARAGGLASVKSRQEKALFRKLVEQLLTQEAPKPLKEALEDMGYEPGKRINCLDALLKICVSKSYSPRTTLGHLTRFLEFAYEAIGEKKTELLPGAQIVFVDKDDVKEANDHINSVINKSKGDIE